MVHFIGAGPGDPELLTIKGKKLIDSADVIIYAGSLVNEKVLEDRKKCAVVYNSAYMTLTEIIDVMKAAEEKGQSVARVHTGDPSIYGAIREQMDALDALGISYEVIPGVSSFLAAAASMKKEYTLPGVSQTVILSRLEGRTPVPEKEKILSLAKHHATMIIFLSVGKIEVLVQLMSESYEKNTPAAVVYKASWPEEACYPCTVGTLAQTGEAHGISKTALIIVGEVVAHQNYQRSRLYDPEFTTGYRRGRNDEDQDH